MITDYTNLFYGNGETDRFINEGTASKWFYIKAQCGNTIPHAVLPFGRISAGAYSGGYPTGYGTHFPNACGGIQKLPGEMKIRGFSHLHQSGTGAIRYYYNYAVVSPFYGEKNNMYEYHIPEYEKASPGFYETKINGIKCSLTVTDSAAVHEYRFGKEKRNVGIDFSNDGLCREFGENFYGIVKGEEFFSDGKNTVFFSGIFSGVKLYFAAVCDSGTVKLYGDMSAVWENTDSICHVRVSYSTCGFEKAAENIKNADKSFEEIADDALKIWEKHLSAIEIETDDEELKEKFYSNFYHTIVKPSDMTGECVLGIKDKLVCDIATFWDMYKTQMPLVFMLYGDMGKKVADCIVNISRTRKAILCSLGISDIFPCEEQAKMLGIYMLLDAYHMGLAELKDIEECIQRELEREDVRSFVNTGYFERYTHITDTADACRYVAELTEDKTLKEKLSALSENWVKAYDDDNIMSEKSPYYEGDRYTYSFRLQSNMEERLSVCGGREAYAKLLDDFFGFNGEKVSQITYVGADKEIAEKKYHRFQGFNNECDMETPYSYIYADNHDRLCEILNACVNDSFGNGKGGLPGNNDSGGLSSCFMWNVLGIFPKSGSGEFLIGAPFVKRSKIRLSNEKILEIDAVNLSKDNYFVEKVTFNGREISDWKISAEDIMNGGKLVFYMRAAV